MFSGGFGTSFASGQKSVLPPENVGANAENLQINLPALMQALGDHEVVANSFTQAFAQMEAELENYPVQQGEPVAVGSGELLERMQRESQDLEKAGRIGEILVEQVERLRAEEAVINAELDELRRNQLCLSILELDKISQPDYTRMTNQLMEIRPDGGNIDAYKKYVGEEAVELARFLE